MDFPPPNAVQSSRRLVQMSIRLQERINQYNQRVAQLEQQLAAANQNILNVTGLDVKLLAANMRALGIHALAQAQANANSLRLERDHHIFQSTRSDVMVAIKASRFATVGSVNEAAVITGLWINNGWRGEVLVCSNANQQQTVNAIHEAGILYRVLPAGHEANED